MKKRLFAVLLMGVVAAAGLCGCAGHTEQRMQAVYLGVEDYGRVEFKDAANFRYRFFADGTETLRKVSVRDDYAVQNALAEGYAYLLTLQDDLVVSAVPVAGDTQKPEIAYQAPVRGVSGLRTLKNFLATALEPVGTVLYVYGGGWNWQDDGAARQAVFIGLAQSWLDFFAAQNKQYAFKDKTNYAKSYFPHGGFNQYYYAGLDCSGFAGWAIYNVMHAAGGGAGYVRGSTGMAQALASVYGFGVFSRNVQDFRAGDVFSLNGHVWICVGVCEDGSLIIVHSTASKSVSGHAGGGVQLSAVGFDLDCEAYRLVKAYMERYYPKWRERYTPTFFYFADYAKIGDEPAGKFSWHLDARGLDDPDGYARLSAREILADLF